MSARIVCDGCGRLDESLGYCEFCGADRCLICFGDDPYACAWCVENGYAQPEPAEAAAELLELELRLVHQADVLILGLALERVRPTVDVMTDLL